MTDIGPYLFGELIAVCPPLADDGGEAIEGFGCYAFSPPHLTSHSCPPSFPLLTSCHALFRCRYHVFSRQLSQSGDALPAPMEWTWRGAFQAVAASASTMRLVLKHFKPAVAYEFKVRTIAAPCGAA